MTSSPTLGHGPWGQESWYLWSNYECFMMSGWWDIRHLRKFNLKLWSNSMNGAESRMNEQTNKHTYGRKKRQKLYTPQHKCRGYNKFYGHSLPTADSKRIVISYNTAENMCRCNSLSCPIRYLVPVSHPGLSCPRVKCTPHPPTAHPTPLKSISYLFFINNVFSTTYFIAL